MMPRKAILPAELSRYEGRQRQLLDIIYSSGAATAREIHAQLLDAPESVAGIRTLLGRMTSGGAIKKRRIGWSREIVYVPAFTSTEIQLLAFRRIADLHFGGSHKSAVEALAKLAMEEERRDIAA